MQSTSNKGSKGSIGVANVKGRVRLNLPRQWFGGKQEQRGLGLDWSDDNEALARRVAKRLELDFQEGKLSNPDGNFNEEHYQKVLTQYGIKASLRVVKGGGHIGMHDTPQKPAISILEVWDMYCEYKKNRVAETTYKLIFQGNLKIPIAKAIAVVGEDAIKIHNWLLSNYAHRLVKNILSHLSHAYKLAIKQKLLTHNPFEGLSENIEVNSSQKTISQEDKIDDELDLFDKSKSYSWDEAQGILEYIESDCKIEHWHPFIKFKFLTGCRSGEAIALWWCDVFWDNECIFIRRSYSESCKIYKHTKNGHKRKFPMPKNGELWNLLKSLPYGEPNNNVFLNKRGKAISQKALNKVWFGNKDNETKGIIPTLIEHGKLTKYLPPYNTRHTFINHQINDIGIAPHIVNAWCEHSEDVSKAHYRDLDLRIIPGYGETKVNEKSEIELLREQNKQLMERLESMEKLIQKLTEK